MAEKLEAPLPLGFVLGPGWTVRVTAVSPTDGSTVSGVKTSGVVINFDKAADRAALTAVPALLVNESAPG